MHTSLWVVIVYLHSTTIWFLMCTTKKLEVRGACELENIVYEREDRSHLSSPVIIDSACMYTPERTLFPGRYDHIFVSTSICTVWSLCKQLQVQRCRARNIAGDLRCGGILVTISTSALLFMVRATYMWFAATQQQNRDHSSMQIPGKNTRFRFLLKQDFPLNG